MTEVLERIDGDTLEEGDRVTILVNGQPYETEMVRGSGQHLVQRFVKDPENAIFKRLRVDGEEVINPNGDIKDLNDLAIRFARGEFTPQEYGEFNMAIGYSVCGWCDVISGRWDVDIDNPIWEAPEYPDESTKVEITVSLTSAARVALSQSLDDMDDDGGDVTIPLYGARATREELIAALRVLAEKNEDGCDGRI